ncbi:hypothetical protein [Psychroserpens jangbogonensis]|uniref:hypothetical protein n=1 Tax=Psychroserpens jangbogonensis TaxID=1484460 RepID=UPI00053D175F|nr:hypothetical protein [Psychroserpens jangbogonensis]
MMKNFKLFLFSFVLIAGFLTSCSNNESVVDEQNIDETEAITQSLNRLAEQFNDEGYVIASENPSGNIVFDFCFDFVYPLNLSYNNGTTVSIASLDDLITILINSTDDLYISGVEFPFDVEVYNDDSDAIEIVTINNEDEFFDLLEDCDFDSIDECDCEDEVDPVCVEVQDPTGESFIITYPNECLAFCDGFTEADFAENCEDDYNCPGGNECFEFVYPITILTDDNQTITINSQEELDSALYNVYYFDFVYPFEVTTEEGDVEFIEDFEDFEDLLEDCFYDGNDDDCECEDEEFDPVCVEVENPNGVIEIFTFPNECIAECEGFDSEDFIDCGNTGGCDCEDEEFDPVCVQVEFEGQLVTYTFPNACIAECEGFDSEDFVDCEDDTNPNNCSEEEVFAYLLECNWYINTSLYDNVNAEYAQFSQDGSVTIYSDGSNDGVSGTWGFLPPNPAGDISMFFNVTSSPFDMISELDWTVSICSEGFIVLESGNEFIQLERDCD